MTALAYRSLGFNETFTPACFGPRAPAGMQLAGPGQARAASLAGERREQEQGKGKGEIQLVYYVGVARESSIVLDHGRQRKVLAQVVSGMLPHVPPLVSRYSLGYGRTRVLFLRSEGYTYFSICDESLGRERAFQVLTQIQEAFLECMARHTPVAPRSASARHAPAGAAWGQLCTSASASAAPAPPSITGCAGSPQGAQAAHRDELRSGREGAQGNEGNQGGDTEGPPGTPSVAFEGTQTAYQGTLGEEGPGEGERRGERGAEGFGGGDGGRSGGRGGTLGAEAHHERSPDAARRGRALPPALRRTRSASQAGVFVSEAMEGKLSEIVARCKGPLAPRTRLEPYPDAPGAYLTNTVDHSPGRYTHPGANAGHLPHLVHQEGFGPEAICRGYRSRSAGNNDSTRGRGGSDSSDSTVLIGSGGKSMSARESLLSEIEEMLREVDLPRTPPMPGVHRAALGPRGVGIPRTWWEGGTGEEEEEEEGKEGKEGEVEGEWEGGEEKEEGEEEEEHIPGLQVLQGGTPKGHRWLSVGGSKAWAPPLRKGGPHRTGVPAHPRYAPGLVAVSASQLSTPCLGMPEAVERGFPGEERAAAGVGAVNRGFAGEEGAVTGVPRVPGLSVSCRYTHSRVQGSKGEEAEEEGEEEEEEEGGEEEEGQDVLGWGKQGGQAPLSNSRRTGGAPPASGAACGFKGAGFEASQVDLGIPREIWRRGASVGPAANVSPPLAHRGASFPTSSSSSAAITKNLGSDSAGKGLERSASGKGSWQGGREGEGGRKVGKGTGGRQLGGSGEGAKKKGASGARQRAPAVTMRMPMVTMSTPALHVEEATGGSCGAPTAPPLARPRHGLKRLGLEGLKRLSLFPS